VKAERDANFIVLALQELVTGFGDVAAERRDAFTRILASAMSEATKLGLAATVGKIEEHETNLSHLLTQAKIEAAKIEFELAVESREKFKSVLGSIMTYALRSASSGSPAGGLLKSIGLL
jgi:hypothetical protein